MVTIRLSTRKIMMIVETVGLTEMHFHMFVLTFRRSPSRCSLEVQVVSGIKREVAIV